MDWILTKLASLSLRYPKSILVAWALFLIGFGSFAPKLPAVLQDHGLRPDGAYAQVQSILASDFHIPDDPVILVFEKEESVTAERFRLFIEQTLSRLEGLAAPRETISALDREGMIKGNFAYALLSYPQPSHEMKPVLEELHRRLPDEAGFMVSMTGKAVVQADVNRASERDLGQAERLGIPVAFVILWLAFRGLVPAAIPVALGVIGVSGTLGMLFWLGTRVELSNFVLNVIPMVGLGLSIDFALMIVSRFQEELQRGSRDYAFLTTMRTAGRAVLFSASSVFLGLLGILLIPLPMFSSIALGAMTVLTVSVCLALTLAPALLALLWPYIQPRRQPVSPFTRRNIWYSLSLHVMKRPVRMGLLAAGVLFVCFLPLGRMQMAIPDSGSLPPDYSSRKAFETWRTHFADGSGSEVYVVAQGTTRDLKKEDWLDAYALVQRLEADPGVKKVDSIFSTLPLTPDQLYFLLQKPALRAHYEPVLAAFVQDRKLLLRVSVKGEPSSPEVRSWLRHREQEGMSSKLRFQLGGEAKYQQEVFDAIFHNLQRVLLFILISNYAVLFLAFRSVLMPLKIILMNLLSLGASFGILVWIFQEGRFGMEAGSIAIMIPVFIFGLVFGISMDYGVFLVSRVYEVYRLTQDHPRAVREGLTLAGRMITSAAAILIAVTVPFAFGEVAGVKQLGIGIAAAILIDATIVRMVLVPVLLMLLGRWNWWAPRWRG
jgi:putative drug exporter of the RND superfamily